MRVKITLVCSECKQRNYDSTKNKRMILIVLNSRSIAGSAVSTPFTRNPSKGSNEKQGG